MENLTIRLETEKDFRAVEELTREVRVHNNFAQRMPVVEQEIRDVVRRVDTLQRYHME